MRVRVELGGTTEVLDRGITETEEDREATDALAHPQTREYTENRSQNDPTEMRQMRVCECIYMYSD